MKQSLAADLASKSAAVLLKDQEIHTQKQLVIKLEGRMKQMSVDEQVLTPCLHELGSMQPRREGLLSATQLIMNEKCIQGFVHACVDIRCLRCPTVLFC